MGNIKKGIKTIKENPKPLKYLNYPLISIMGFLA
jgi:hypothetical protein